MVSGLENTEDTAMKCHVCGGRLASTISDFPFRVGPTTIVVVKRLPILECTDCMEFSIEDSVMATIESILEQTDETTELAVIPYVSAAV